MLKTVVKLDKNKMNQKIIETLRGTIDINQRQQAEEELAKVRNNFFVNETHHVFRLIQCLCVLLCVFIRIFSSCNARKTRKFNEKLGKHTHNT